jgi:hypothetical protein
MRPLYLILACLLGPASAHATDKTNCPVTATCPTANKTFPVAVGPEGTTGISATGLGTALKNLGKSEISDAHDAALPTQQKGLDGTSPRAEGTSIEGADLPAKVVPQDPVNAFVLESNGGLQSDGGLQSSAGLSYALKVGFTAGTRTLDPAAPTTPAIQSGARFMATKNPQAADAQFKQALAQDPNNVTALTGHMLAARAMGDTASALQTAR